jgi:uncharacterized protein (DUF2252 family)
MQKMRVGSFAELVRMAESWHSFYKGVAELYQSVIAHPRTTTNVSGKILVALTPIRKAYVTES